MIMYFNDIFKTNINICSFYMLIMSINIMCVYTSSIVFIIYYISRAYYSNDVKVLKSP